MAVSDEQDAIIQACWGVVAIGEAVFSDRLLPTEIDELQHNIPVIAKELSKNSPPSYNGITAGLQAVVEYKAHTAGTPAPSQDRAAVLGVWCVNDTVRYINNASTPLLQSAETQQQLVEVFKASIDHNAQ